MGDIRVVFDSYFRGLLPDTPLTRVDRFCRHPSASRCRWGLMAFWEGTCRRP